MASRFVRAKNDPTVYLREGAGSLRAISSADEFARLAGTTDMASQTDVVESLADEDRRNASLQADAQINPEVRGVSADLENERRVAETSAKRLQDSIAQVYQRKRMNDPLAREGIVSGASQNFETEEEVKNTREVGQDLGNKLSYIAQRLTNTNQGATEKKSALLESMQQRFSKERDTNRYATEDRRIALEDRAYNRTAQESSVQREKASQSSSIFLQFLNAEKPMPKELYELFSKVYGV